MEPIEAFYRRNAEKISQGAADEQFIDTTRRWFERANSHEYSYHFTWLSRPIIQYPQDIVAMQEIIWHTKPDLIIETGIAHGGSLIMSASMLALIDYCDACKKAKTIDPANTGRRVLGIDIDIRAHNRSAIESHPMSHRIDMIQGSSIAPDIIAKVQKTAQAHQRILVCLDSNHTHDHVLAELEAYAPLVSKDSYCVVFDTVIEDMPADAFPYRQWGKGNNPKTALEEFLGRLQREGRTAMDGEPLHFEIDKQIQNKLLITVAQDGYLRRVEPQA
jgi:cephalosporin hydroxylase